MKVPFWVFLVVSTAVHVPILTSLDLKFPVSKPDSHLIVIDRLGGTGKSLRTPRRFSQRGRVGFQAPNGARHPSATHAPGSTMKVLKGNQKPPYPLLARRLGITGTAIVQVFITQSGTIREIVFKKTSGHPVLDRAIMKTVRKWHIPHQRNKGYWLTLPPFEFRLKENAKTQRVGLAR